MAKKIKKLTKKIDSRLKEFSKQKLRMRKVIRKGPKPALDLRPRPEREVPVKQHGFKEGDIGHGGFL